MREICINGGYPLRGKVKITGMKNAAVAIIFATLAVNGKCIIENIPDISDVSLSLKILSSIGAVTDRIDADTVEIDTTGVNTDTVTTGFEKKMRASYYLLGGLLGRFGKAKVGIPGGCDFGDRPIDQHIKAFECLGAKVSVTDDTIEAVTLNGLRNANIFFDCVTVGGTVNAIIASSITEGTTVLFNAAKEPHIVDLANFLNFCGADIRGAGTDTIKIKGVKELHGCTYTIIPDMIEAGTYMAACIITRGRITVENVIPKHLEPIIKKFGELGAQIDVHDDYVDVLHNGMTKCANVKTLPYPGFPTDMNPQMTAVLSLARGVSRMEENIWDDRFKYVSELRKMGADIKVNGNEAVICGVDWLLPSRLCAMDLRAGAAMVIAGLAANGTSQISNIELIERGYEKFTEKLKLLGANVKITDI